MATFESTTPPLPLLLPEDTILTYFAEGAANVVYMLSGPSAPPKKLLRLNKALPSRVPVAASHAEYISTFTSLLPAAHLVQQDLVLLPPSLIQNCNEALLTLEASGARPPKRRGLYLAPEEPHGLLMTDMSADKARGEHAAEFKPKWLLQSPSAPAGSRRCRTCALRARNGSLRRKKGKEPEAGFCPLDLVSGDRGRFEAAVRAAVRGKLAPEQLRKVTAYLDGCGVLGRLREVQAQMDPEGVLGADAYSREFRIAMTVRDCTVFVKIGGQSEGEVELRLADLDLKSAKEGKAEYWRALEEELIRDGWYMGEEANGDEEKIWCQGLDGF